MDFDSVLFRFGAALQHPRKRFRRANIRLFEVTSRVPRERTVHILFFRLRLGSPHALPDGCCRGTDRQEALRCRLSGWINGLSRLYPGFGRHAALRSADHSSFSRHRCITSDSPCAAAVRQRCCVPPQWCKRLLCHKTQEHFAIHTSCSNRSKNRNSVSPLMASARTHTPCTARLAPTIPSGKPSFCRANARISSSFPGA